MPQVIRAIVTTNSSEDPQSRVKIKIEGVWESDLLVESLGGIPLKKDDVVFVDISDGWMNPLIIGRSISKDVNYSESVDGSLLYESSNGSDWTIAYVKHDKLTISNSKGVKIVVDGDTVKIDGKVEINKGKLGGMVKKDAFKSLQDAVKNFAQQVSTDGVLSGYGCVITTSAAATLLAKVSSNVDFENKEVKQ